MPNQEKVLIVEDEENALMGLAELVSGWGYRTDTARDGLEGLERAQAWHPGIVLTDLKMPRMDGLELLERHFQIGKDDARVPGLSTLQSFQAIVLTDLKMPRMDGLELLERLGELKQQNQAVIVITAQGSIAEAVEAMKIGAYDFIQKPIDPNRLRTILANATRQRETQQELEVTRRKLRDTGVLGSLVGSSKKMQELFGLIERVATSNVSVLITGESGTGKELVARTLHDLSPRKNKPFVAVNCAAIPETLIESEIFG